MFIKVTDLDTNRPSLINPEQITKISVMSEVAIVFLTNSFITINTVDFERICSVVGFAVGNGSEPEKPTTSAHIIRIERDTFYSKTSGSERSMWRCRTGEGYEVNIFDHTDPLRNTFKLFEAAGYDGYLKTMKIGQVDIWDAYPIEVELRINGNFWNVVSVTPRGIVGYPTRLDETVPDDDIPFEDALPIGDPNFEQGRADSLGGLGEWADREDAGPTEMFGYPDDEDDDDD